METQNKVITWKVSESSQSSDFSHHVASTFSRKSSNQSDKDCNKEITISTEFNDLGLTSPHENFQPSKSKNRNKLVNKVTKLMKSKGIKSPKDVSHELIKVDQSSGLVKTKKINNF